MNNEYSKVGLYDHNAESYKKVSDAFKEEDIVAIVHATGTGKSYNALQLAYDNKDKKIVYVVPSHSIIEHIKKIINNNPNLSFERDFPNLEFRTYQSFINMDMDEISEIDVDMLILDEFHHIGAPVWGARTNSLIETHPNIKVFGMTAYTVRDRGTSYERDMTNPDTDELFSNKVVSRYDLCDAMIDGVLPKPIYKSAYVNLIGTEKILEEKVRAFDATSKEYQEYMAILTDVKKRIQEAPSISDVVKRNIKPNGKYIYFCPPSSEDGINDINTIMEEAKKWFLDMGLSEEDIILYSTTSEMGIEGKNNRDAFYSDVDADGRSVDGKLRVMFAINQYNEGIHAPNVDGVIMGRGTTSDIIYFEQLGRALSVRGETKEKFDEYEKYSVEELLNLCKKRDIPIKDSTPKEEIIEKLLAPIIIDLTNNFDFIRELENNLRDRIKDIQAKGLGDKRIIKIRDASFDIEIANQNLFEMLRYVSDRLTMTWEDKYEYAKSYYEHHGNLELQHNFRTNNGYTFDENGIIRLGSWVFDQRRWVLPESERGQLLSQIGMRWENKNSTLSWEEMYEYAKAYYEHHGNLEVLQRFKTSNGYDYDEIGNIRLGSWISTQRRSVSPESKRGQILSQIGMRWENKYLPWEEMYEYAKAYYEHHGNLEVPSNFKTNNGYDYDENGKINLGAWIGTQRKSIIPKSDQGMLLSQIGMRWENKNSTLSWEEMYEYAKSYYEHHGNLEVQTKFKTNNGYEYDENGKINLGAWIHRQRVRLIPESKNGKLLSQIGMRWENSKNTLSWKKMYEYAKAYYEHHGNLEVPSSFKTNNGYEYDENGKINLGQWIKEQRRKILLESEQGQLLSKIGMRFQNIINRLTWEEMYEYAKAYYEHHGNLEVAHRFKTNNGFDYDEKGKINLGAWIGTQRRSVTPESEQGQLLSQIDMRFENIHSTLSWEKMYEYAKSYYEHYGNLEVPSNFKTNNGYDYDEKGKINLGAWIGTQRRSVTPENEQGQLLSQIGMRWENKNSTLSWEEMYEYAKLYYEHHRNLKVSKKFKTNNGYEYDENGTIKLGEWIGYQRKSVFLESERGQFLSQIGMIWDVKSNREKVEKICIENNIDMNINKIIVSHISIQELKSTIEFLRENNISLMDTQGKLHEIFAMSSTNMQVKYGVSLEELINKYYVTSMKKGGI